MMHSEQLRVIIQQAFKEIFHYDNLLYRINIDMIEFSDRARVEIEVLLTTVALDSICDFRNLVEEKLECHCVMNVDIKKSKFILALKEK